MQRPTRPTGHTPTCDCFTCGLYWSLSLDHEAEMMRQRHDRDMQARLVALQKGVSHQNLNDYLDAPFVGQGLLEEPERRKVLLQHFREAWGSAEADGFTTLGVHVEVIWAIKERCFFSAAMKTRDELGMGPHLRTEKTLQLEMTRIRLRMALLRDLARRGEAGPRGRALALKEAERLQLELDPRTGAEL